MYLRDIMSIFGMAELGQSHSQQGRDSANCLWWLSLRESKWLSSNKLPITCYQSTKRSGRSSRQFSNASIHERGIGALWCRIARVKPRNTQSTTTFVLLWEPVRSKRVGHVTWNHCKSRTSCSNWGITGTKCSTHRCQVPFAVGNLNKAKHN